VLFRSSSSAMQKSNLILVLTPYIIREQSDLRTVFERKMQERQEFLDHYFVFSDQTEYEPPKDYSRMNGLLENIRESYDQVSEQRRLEDLTRPRGLMRHEPGLPLELPTTVGSEPGGAPTQPVGLPTAAPPVSGQAPNPAPPAPPTLNVAPPPRNVERIER